MYDGYCENCRFWATNNDTVGECRRNNPVPIVSGGVTSTSPYVMDRAAMWPFTRETDWCGEHTPVEQLQAIEEEV